MSYINKQGGTHSPMCNRLTIEIWEICIKHLSHSPAVHIPGMHNVIADLTSHKFQDSAEWMISTGIFDKLCSIFGISDIYLFVSRLNKQLEHYASWLPDPGSCIIDAMSVSWHSQYVYIFVYELIRTFKKRAFNLRSPVTKYHKMWDPDVLLSYLESMETAKPIHLSMKTGSLTMLLSEYRVNTVENLKITNMYISETECTFVFSSVLKHS